MGKKKKESRLVPEKLWFVAELGRTSSWIGNRYTEFLKPFGISPQQFNILRVLRTSGEWVAMNEVNELLIIKSPNITRLADKLVIKKLAIRKRSVSDRRVVYIQITKLGLDLLSKIDIEHEGAQSEYMDRFTVEEAELLTKVLKRIRA